MAGIGDAVTVRRRFSFGLCAADPIYRAFILRQPVRARARLACGSSRKNSSEVPLEKQYSLPSSGSVQLREQSALILAPAATPSGSRLSNSPRIDAGGTAAFQIPPPGAAPAAADCASEKTAAAHRAAASSANAHECTAFNSLSIPLRTIPLRPFHR